MRNKGIVNKMVCTGLLVNELLNVRKHEERKEGKEEVR